MLAKDISSPVWPSDERLLESGWGGNTRGGSFCVWEREGRCPEAEDIAAAIELAIASHEVLLRDSLRSTFGKSTIADVGD